MLTKRQKGQEFGGVKKTYTKKKKKGKETKMLREKNKNQQSHEQ